MVVSSVLAFVDGTGGPFADMWHAWSGFVSPVGELYGFLTPPVFTVLIVAVFVGFIFLIRETSAGRGLNRPIAALSAVPSLRPQPRPDRPPAHAAAAAFGTIRAGLINGQQFAPRDVHRTHDDFTLCTGLTRPAQSSTPSQLVALRCKPDLNFHLDRADGRAHR